MSLTFNTTNNQVNGYIYDAPGNLYKDDNHIYTYDAEGNLTQVDGGSTAIYVYDALNHRVRTTVGSTVTEFVFNQSGQRVSEWNGTTRAPLKGHYYWGTTPVAFYDTSALHFEHQDWQGTERMRTSYNGAVEATFASLPFGDGWPAAATSDPYGFAMLDYDAETETDHAQFRQYSSAQGRWLSPDPYMGSYNMLDPQSMNRYVYVTNNPESELDPSGLNACVIVYTPYGGAGSPYCASPNFGDEEMTLAQEQGTYLGMTNFTILQYWEYVNMTYDGTDSPGTWTPIFDTFTGDTGSFTVLSGLQGGGGAPNNGTPQQPPKPPCNPSTRIAGMLKAADGLSTTLIMSNLAALHYAAGGFIIGVTCGTPEPGEPLACAAGIFGGGSLFAGGTALGYGAYKVATDEMIPGIKQAITCQE